MEKTDLLNGVIFHVVNDNYALYWYNRNDGKIYDCSFSTKDMRICLGSVSLITWSSFLVSRDFFGRPIKRKIKYSECITLGD